MIETLYLQNFTLRKDYFCCKARKYSIVLRIVAIVAYVVDGLIYRWRTNIEGYLLYCFGAVHVVIAGIAFAGYFQGGIDIYRHSLPKLCLLSTIIAHLSLSIAMFLNLQTNSPSTFTINFFLLLSFITFFTHFLIARFKKQSLIKSSLTDLTTKIYFVLHHLECSATNIESDCLILGLIRAHIIAHNCLNPKCFIYTPADDLYDSKKRKIVNTNHIAGSLTGLTKFYLKCLYESAIIEHPNDNELLLQYIEFMYLKLKNAFQAVLLLTKMENDGKTLTDFQQLRVNRLRKVII